MNTRELTKMMDVKQSIANTFDLAASTYDRVGPLSFTLWGRRLVELISIHNGASVLDVGTGGGAVLFRAAEVTGPGGRVVGIDISKGMVERTAEEIRRQGIGNAEVRQMDAENLEFPEATFDYVLCGFSVFFFPCADRALLESYRVLKPGGRIAMSTCGPGDKRWTWFSHLKKLHWPREIPELKSSVGWFSDVEQLTAFTLRAGFVKAKIVREVAELVYFDEDEWWSYLQSSGLRGALDIIEKVSGPNELASLKADAFRNMQPLRQADGFHQTRTLLFTVAEKPL